jgi:hypothetical protein
MKKYQSEGKSIVYVDESGFSHESTRSHGYAKILVNSTGAQKDGQTPLEHYSMDCY